MTAESLLLGAHASAVLEGSSSTLAEVRAGDGDEIEATIGRLQVKGTSITLMPAADVAVTVDGVVLTTDATGTVTVAGNNQWCC